MGKIYQVLVHGLRGEKMIIDLCNTEEQMQKMTVLQLKEKIAIRLPETAGVDAVRLIFTDKMLDGDTRLLSDYGIQHMSVIHMALILDHRSSSEKLWEDMNEKCPTCFC